MNLTPRLSKDVFHHVQNKGNFFFIQKKVEIIDGTKNAVSAQVNGKKLFGVEVIADKNTLKVTCTCPYFKREGKVCEHIWATLLAAQEDDFLSQISPKGDLQFKTFELEQAAKEAEKPVQKSNWSKVLLEMESNVGGHAFNPVIQVVKRIESEIYFVLNYDESLSDGVPFLEFWIRQKKKSGEWKAGKPYPIDPDAFHLLHDTIDRRVAILLQGADTDQDNFYSHYRFKLKPELATDLIPLLCESGRLFLKGEETPCKIDPNWQTEPWKFYLKFGADKKYGFYMKGILKKKKESLEIKDVQHLFKGGWLVRNNQIEGFRDFNAFSWIPYVRKEGKIYFSKKEQTAFLEHLFKIPNTPPIEWTTGLNPKEKTIKPKPVLKIQEPNEDKKGHKRLRMEVAFNYDGTVINASESKQTFYSPKHKHIFKRNFDFEDASVQQLFTCGCRLPVTAYDEMEHFENHDLELAPTLLPDLVRILVSENWHIEAQGRIYRQANKIEFKVSSNMDWFNLEGNIQFGNQEIAVPDLLHAIKEGKDTLTLGDGSIGILPEEWLKRFGILLSTAKVDDEDLLFKNTQVGILDTFLSEQENVSWDEGYARARKELSSFEGIKSMDPSKKFKGKLRPYQKDALGWLSFCNQFGFGGCLADDMGLGKTVQILAFIEQFYSENKNKGKPTLIVVPKSLVFNWQSEAKRFTPDLSVLKHVGSERVKDKKHLKKHNLVITTYGTLRRDIELLKEINFGYVILDEAQAIKNAQSESAKAARLLDSDYRLALSGTPIENHLGELWSIFEFLNPGMLGKVSVFKEQIRNDRTQDINHGLLAKSLRPFILRRTKEEVLKDLPKKFEQTLIFEMTPEERQFYNELRDHYRAQLLKPAQEKKEGDTSEKELKKSKLLVLEALLRLRQAACHPGLVKKNMLTEGSSKIDLILERLEEIYEEGRKALVFSQFTSLLAILKDALDEKGLPYEYLDGQTKDRQEKVTRFQEDDECKIFLISLKAGGLGLNLTKAEYVFLLDPWWNPAVEAQAIDRAHRMGQKNQVFAYRIIAKDTVEEKVLSLQAKKKKLADSIINGNNSMISNMTREDLELLLS